MIKANQQPTYKRQRFLLSFIQQLNEDIALTNLQKLVFLYCMNEKLDHYDFIPYKYGPYSFQLKEDIDILCKNGFISYRGPYLHSNEQQMEVPYIHAASERGDDLIRRTYQEYPYYTVNSIIINRLYPNNAEMKKVLEAERQKYNLDEQILFTIGYEGRSLESFINTLITNGVKKLCDVRRNPISRKFGFSREKLEHVIENTSIDYVHIPALGIDSKKRQSLDTEDAYSDLFREYAQSLPSHNRELEYLYSLLCSDKRIALMCYEKEPSMCHRHVIRDYLCSKYPIRSVDL